MSEAPSHYRVLGVSVTASDSEIKSAYRRKVRETHPDLGGNSAEFDQVRRAFEVLSDASARASYDRSFGSTRPAGQPRTSSPYDAAGSANASSNGSTRFWQTDGSGSTGSGHGKARASDPAIFVPPFVDGQYSELTKAQAMQRVYGVPRKRGLFSQRPRLEREARVIKMLMSNILEGFPSARLVNGLHTPHGRGYIDHAVLAGYRLALIDSMMLPEGVYQWDGQTLRRDGRVIEPPRLIDSVRLMQSVFPELNVMGFAIVLTPSNSPFDPVIDEVRRGNSEFTSPLEVTNSANAIRELKMFLGSGPQPNVVDVGLYARLIRAMHD
ncbi:J domain-containing protein [Neomicrococcus lactis]